MITIICNGQKYYFSSKNYSDSISLAKSIPDLAKQVIIKYKSSDKEEYFDNLFRYQLVAEEFNAAKNSIDSIRKFNKKSESAAAMGIQYESYLLTKIKQKTDNHSFDILYPSVLSNLLQSLPEKAKTSAEGYFMADVNEMKTKLNKLLTTLDGAKKDTITLDDAKSLCRAYNGYNVFKQIKKLSRIVLAEEEDRKYVIQDSVLIPTKDGAQLSAIIVKLRSTSITQSAIMMYNIYAGPRDKTKAKEAADHGYVGIIVNTRGKYLSPQAVEPFEHDASDAYDVMDWISKHPWCNGKIGMYGGSYLGFSQWSAVRKVHPALKTIVPQVAVGIGIDYPNHNGVFMSYMLQWIHYVSNKKLTDADEFFDFKKWNDLYRRWYTSGKSFRSLDSLEGRPNDLFQRWLNHPGYDSFWHSMVPYQNQFSNINIPILTTTGYFDDDQRGAFFYFNQHHKFNKNADHYLLIGPYDHYGAQSFAKPHLLGYTLDSVANININDYVFQWFDHVLKDGKMPSILKDKINYQVMGTNEWRHASSLAKMNNDTITYYISNVRTKSNYKLVQTKPKINEYINQEIDYTDRSDSSTLTEDFKIMDSVLTVDESLSFISDPLQKDVEINGSFSGGLSVIINKKDIDVTIELYEKLQNGKYFRLSTYLARASYAKDRSKRQLLKPGKEEIIPINNSYFVSKRLNKGSRIVVKVGILKRPAWQINYGTGKDVSDESMKDGLIPLQIRWSNGSHFKLPIYK
ncbi:MAG TPA: CocE/NonD family hydrolase [Cyclobacteriaceae bacterium]|jgi:putative CocE/NonD family hydrolase|nr:CocE/NonD family hydrolase [Cyclobacteriaceae bacterium]